MVGIQASNGLITGIPVQDTIDKLLEIAARPRIRLENRVKDLKAQKLAVTEITALVIGIELAAKRLGSTDLFKKTSVSTSDEKLLAATITGTPLTGNHQYTPIRRAQSHQLLSQGFASKTAPLGAGAVTIGFGGQLDRGVRLDELNQGQGIERGRIKITDRSGSSAVIDLRYATSMDDVLRAINENGDVRVEAIADGDRIRLVDQTGQTTSNLRVQEVGGTSTAADLGLGNIDVAASVATGADVLGLYEDLALSRLNDGNGVRLRKGVADLQATLADGTVLDLDFFAQKKGETAASGTTNAKNGVNAQVKITSTGTGPTFDGYRLVFQDDAEVTAGNEKISFDALAKTFTVKIDAGNTRAAEVIAKLNADSTFAASFTASAGTGGSGTGVVDVGDTLTTSGGAIEYYNESTVGDVIDSINRVNPTKLQARLSASGDSLELVDLTSGAGTFSVASAFGGSAAEDLGLTTSAVGGVITGERRLAGLKTVLLDSLAGGAGLGTLGTISITARDGTSRTIDLSNASTLGDVLRTINDAGGGVTARVNGPRNGIELVDTTGGTGQLVIANQDATNTATKLKLAGSFTSATVNSGSLALQTVHESQSLASLRNGRGIGKGSFLITNSLGQTGAVNTTVLGATTVGDIVDGINALSLGVTARINDAGDGLLLIDNAGGSGELRVEDVGSGTAARDLKIAGTSVVRDLGGTPTKVIDGSYTLKVELDSDDTLQDLISKVNNLGGDVSASFFSTGSGLTPYRLTINSLISGAAGELLVDGSGAGVRFQESAAAQDALLLFGSPDAPIPGALISSATNDFENVIDGVRLTVNGSATTAQNISITKTSSTILSQVKLFVEQYNKLQDKLKDVATLNAETGATGVLFGTSDVLFIDLDFSAAMSSRFLSTGTIQSFEQLGISPDSQGRLQLNEKKFEEKYNADSAAIERFFTQSGTGAAAKLGAVAKRLSGVDNSTLVNRANSLQRSIDYSEQQIKFMNSTLERQREQMVKQFSQLEQVVSRMQSSMASIARIQPIPYASSAQR